MISCDSYCRDIENKESTRMLASDEPGVGDDESNAESAASVDLPVMAVVARTGSRIIRRQSGRGFALDSPNAQGSSASVNRNSGAMQVVGVAPIFCALLPFLTHYSPWRRLLRGAALSPTPTLLRCPSLSLGRFTKQY